MNLILQPYKHYIKENFFSSDQLHVLSDFTLKSPWVYYDDIDFPQYIIQREFVENFFLNQQTTSEKFKFVFSENFISSLEPLFGLQLEECVGISFHKLIRSNFNIIHNDSNTNGEKLRIVCYLSNPEKYEGGELNLYSNHNLSSAFISHKLHINTAFIFEMNEESFHSVNTVTSGERICIVITYQ
jgi:predicted 2-oxoglutarate/Fe(II)-dependent dioxygenase YbiX